MDIETYVKENPAVWDAFKQYTIQAVRSGRTRLSARLVIERIRWDSMIGEKDREFKINNNIAPKLARKFMSEYSGFDNFFQTRN